MLTIGELPAHLNEQILNRRINKVDLKTEIFFLSSEPPDWSESLPITIGTSITSCNFYILY